MIGWSNFRFGFSVLRTGKKITKEVKEGRRSTMSRAFSTRLSAGLIVFLATACLAAGLRPGLGDIRTAKETPD
jgi:hypothetical protein